MKLIRKPTRFHMPVYAVLEADGREPPADVARGIFVAGPDCNGWLYVMPEERNAQLTVGGMDFMLPCILTK